MLAPYSRFQSQVALALRHLALSQIVELESAALQLRATTEGLTLPDQAERRRLAYRSAIIETYSSLEDFVMEEAAAYAAALPHVVSKFTDLAERVRENHLSLTLRVLAQRERKVWKGRVEVDEMLERLLSCSKQPDSYRLNDAVFREHTSNFRANVVHQFFGRLDIDLSTWMDLTAADTFVNSESPLSGIVVGARGAVDLLAERRNEIAHGSTDTDTLSHPLLRALLKAVELYGTALHYAVLDALSAKSALPQTAFGQVAKVFHRPAAGLGTIAGVVASSSGERVHSEDWILCRRGDGRIHLVGTRSIHVARSPVAHWSSGAGQNAEGGIWVVRRVAKGWDVFALPDSLRRALGLNVTPPGGGGSLPAAG